MSRMGINVWEVIDAAATKPFGFMPFYPGPGLGGHCIPIDPFYLSWKSKQAGIEARFIELAGHVNGQMPHFVVEKVQNALNDQTKPLRGSHVQFSALLTSAISMTFASRLRSILFILLNPRCSKVTYSDPFVPSLSIDGMQLEAQDGVPATADCAVIITDHAAFDYKSLVRDAALIVDTRNALKNIQSDKIVRL